MAVYTFDQMKRLVQCLVRAEMARDTLAFDYQLLQDNARTQVAKLEQQRDEYAEGYARQRDKVEKLEQQLSDAEGVIEMQAKRLATARMQFDSISKAAGACADAADLDP